jgi:hypothetical protein
VYEEVRVKSRMRKVVSLLFFSFLFSCVCVLKNVNFSMLFGRIKKNQKVQTPKQKRERERERQTDKRVKNSFFFINQILYSSHKEQHSTKDENK